MGKNLEYALKYASAYGWAVFPVDPKTKKPLTPHGCKDAKTAPGPIKAWWKRYPNASIGIATGSASSLIVIDEDYDPDKGLDGYVEVRTWERDHDELPETVCVKTGRGGAHLYYHYTGTDIGNRAGVLDGVDVRGEGGYVIAPPSLHPNGTEYCWEIGPDEMPVTELTDTVRDLIGAGKTKQHGEQLRLPDTIQPGERNDTLYRHACKLQSLGYPDDGILAMIRQINATICYEPLPDDEIQTLVGSALTHQKGELQIVANYPVKWHEPKIAYQIDKDGNVTDRPAQTIANAEEAIGYDENLFGRIRYNELAYVPYVYGNLPWMQYKGWREWTNIDDSNLRSYIEQKYGLKSAEKTMDALANVAARYKVNPVRDMLETCAAVWDGNRHIENLLPAMLGAEKNEYTIAAMKLFMYGAIHRIYYPGCKFDYMLVLVGPQGQGKSTFFRYLAMSDEWYNDNFSTLDGARAIENLRGMWIVEMAELQATKRSKDVETIKSFITSRIDTYRAPYNRRTEQRKRMCVLAGTSNPVDFLTDRTGNRRFLPITCGVRDPIIDMFADEDTAHAEMLQAWGEAMNDFKQGNTMLTLPRKLQQAALNAQIHYQEDDPYIGMIQQWLDNTAEDRVCVMMIWKEALKHEFDDPGRKQTNDLHEIMRNEIHGWHYVGKLQCGKYGKQRCYERDTVPSVPSESTTAPYDGTV